MTYETVKTEPVYLGDGVYASFNGYHIELRLEDHCNPVVVYLEPPVMKQLIVYFNRINKGD